MSLNRLHLTLIAGWFVILGAVLGTRLALGIPTTLIESATVFAAGCIPAMVLLAVFRGAGPRNVTQLLYETERAASGTVPSGSRTGEAGAAGGRG